MKKYIGMRYDEKGFDTLEEAGCWLSKETQPGEFYIAELKLDRQYELCAYMAYHKAIERAAEKARKEGYRDGVRFVGDSGYKRGYEQAKKELREKLGV